VLSEFALPDMIRASLARDSRAMAMDFDGRHYSWGYAQRIGTYIQSSLDELSVDTGERIGFIARTRPSHIAALWGLIAARRCPSMLYAFQSPEKLATDILALRPPVMIADRDDWNPVTIAAARDAGSAGLMLADDGVHRVPGLEKVGIQALRERMPDIGLETLSSGTTGKPKRIPLSMHNLESSARSAMPSLRQLTTAEGRAVPMIMMFPLANISGVYLSTPCGAAGHPLAVLEKFDVSKWLDLVRRYRPPTADLPPAAVLMLLQSNIAASDLQSIKVVRSGASPLDSNAHREFTERFGIPIYLSYGASEFCGIITTWSMQELQKYGAAKRGSSGRPMAGVELRIVDPTSGSVLPPDTMGLLEARVARVGTHWIRTSDLARIDCDGFMWFEGRNDDAIMRGSFKISPEHVAEVLRMHPAVSDAAIVGIPDSRLGHVPAAAIELRPGMTAPTAQEFAVFARRHLAAPQIPVRFVILDELPRTPSLKVHRQRLYKLLSSTPTADENTGSES